MSELIQTKTFEVDPVKTKRLKAVIDALTAGENPEAVKKEFHDIIKTTDAVEVAAMEQSLIEDGLSVDELQKLCEVHADLFRAGLEKGGSIKQISGHPIHTYLAENKIARRKVKTLNRTRLFGSLEALGAAVQELKPIITHYTRKENQLFPYLEKKNFTGPSRVMWGKHDEVREQFKLFDKAYEENNSAQAKKTARVLAGKIKALFFMEEKILFPNAKRLLSEADWAEIRKGEDAIGFAWIRPGAEYDPILVKPEKTSIYANFDKAVSSLTEKTEVQSPASLINLDVGKLPLEVLNLILISLPVDFSFVDADDKVLYYSDNPHRVFPRSPGVIGRDVRNCHPHKSVETVEKILDSFKKKEKTDASFWLELNGKFIYITYKPIYNKAGEYLGTLEMSMDATEIRSLEGRRTLLDW
ncbi:MAG: DUF438 domain-containing protein [Spirochaetota bacterium]|jgi:DUF438 domain-containing protein|nr:DUF438 domain-containing protein [Spirochaetota bacterium]NMA56368.1 DUF438 domain-containing protein [Treponema sp.]